MSSNGYLMAGQQSELERLLVQATAWEPSGAALLARLGEGTGLRVLDAGCGVLGWLRLLSGWVSPHGTVVGTDLDEALLESAGTLTSELGNVQLVRDDLFASDLEPGSFDLVHGRFLVAPLGRGAEQLAAHRKLLAPGGLLVMEEPDSGSWHFNPPAQAAQQLIDLIYRVFTDVGGSLDAGRRIPGLLAESGLDPQINATLLALPAGHPYLRVPIQFSVSLEQRLAELISLAELRELRAKAEVELAEPERWGTSFTLVQTWARVPGE